MSGTSYQPGRPIPLPILQGGTGSTTQNFVDLTTGQSIAGLKNFTNSAGMTLTGGSGTLTVSATSDGGDYNIFSANGNQTLALYGSGGNTLNLHLLDGVASFDGGTNTAAGAVITTPTFVSGTAQQISTTKDAMVYIDVKTAASLTLALGAASTATTVLQSAVVSGLGLSSIRLPAGWFLKITGTIADLTITAITC